MFKKNKIYFMFLYIVLHGLSFCYRLYVTETRWKFKFVEIKLEDKEKEEEKYDKKHFEVWTPGKHSNDRGADHATSQSKCGSIHY
jgi:hypothetical protein